MSCFFFVPFFNFFCFRGSFKCFVYFCFHSYEEWKFSLYQYPVLQGCSLDISASKMLRISQVLSPHIVINGTCCCAYFKWPPRSKPPQFYCLGDLKHCGRSDVEGGACFHALDLPRGKFLGPGRVAPPRAGEVFPPPGNRAEC